MIKRYSDKRLTELWSDENKVAMWQKVELAVIKAREILMELPIGTYERAMAALNPKPVNIAR